VRQLLADAIGPLQELSEWAEADRDWTFAASVQGIPVRVGLNMSDGTVTGVGYGASLDGRPLACVVGPPGLLVPGLPRIVTGDPVFDTRVVVHGGPSYVLERVFDAELRRVLLETHPPPLVPLIQTDEGWLSLRRSCRRAMGGFGDGEMPSAAEIHGWLDFVQRLARCLNGAFDACYAEVARAHGPDAAAAWLAEQHAGHRRWSSREYLLDLFGPIGALFR
jgi:hypothetical protein